LKPSSQVRAKDADRLLPKMGRDPDCVVYACATQIEVVTGGKTEPKLSIRSLIGNTVSLYLSLRLRRGAPQGLLIEVQVKDRGKSEGLFVTKGIGIATSSHAKAGRLPRGLLQRETLANF
jgi:hypothetical protein